MSDVDEPTQPHEPIFNDPPPGRGGHFVGPMFSGRRKSDRWLTYLTMCLMISMFVFVTYTSYQQTQSAKARDEAQEQRNEILDVLRKQNEQILCFADTTQSFELAISNLLLAAQGNPEDPATRQAINELREVQRALLESKRLCFTPVDPSSPTTTLVPTPGTLPDIPTTTEGPTENGAPPTTNPSAITLIPPLPPDEGPEITAARPPPSEDPPPSTFIEPPTTSTTEPPTTIVEETTTTTEGTTP